MYIHVESYELSKIPLQFTTRIVWNLCGHIFQHGSLQNLLWQVTRG